MTCDALRHSAPPPLSGQTCLLPVQPARARPLAWARAVYGLTEACATATRRGRTHGGLFTTARLSPLGEGQRCAREALVNNPRGPTTAVLVVATRLAFVEKLAKAAAELGRALPRREDVGHPAGGPVARRSRARRRGAAGAPARVGCRRLASPMDTRYTRRPEATTCCALVKRDRAAALAQPLDDAANFRTPQYCHVAQRRVLGEQVVGVGGGEASPRSTTDYFLKVDADVVFYKRMSPTPAEAMALSGASFAHTSRLYEADGEAACAGCSTPRHRRLPEASGCAAVDPKAYDSGTYYYGSKPRPPPAALALRGRLIMRSAAQERPRRLERRLPVAAGAELRRLLV